MAIKASLSKANNHNLASMISGDAVDFVSSVVCSVKEYDCCNDSCQNCHGKPMLEEIIQFFYLSENIIYYKWIRKISLYQKTEICESGKLVADSFDEMTTKKFKLHVYNIFRQYAELKHLKKSLGEEEVILSVDFSRKYKNKQCHEIENAYFGHEAFALCTAAYYVKGDTDKALKSTRETLHFHVMACL